MELIDLNYVDCKRKGYKRLKKGKKFAYKNVRGEWITSERSLKRIEKLVIPPAWKKVWICPDPKGHIQSFGFDDKNRKQYIYHERWSLQRNLKKFEKVMSLGVHLKAVQKKINMDLKSEIWNKDKACALGLAVIKKTLMRIGNHKYTKENKSYGLVTLRKNHVTLDKSGCVLAYRGKKGVDQKHILTDKKICNHLSKLYQIPGEIVFRYNNENQNKNFKSLKGKDFNMYLKTICDDMDLSVKSFRIWGATLLTIEEMLRLKDMYDKQKAKQQLNEIIDTVAFKLGNTRTIARNYYIHPNVQRNFITGDFYKISKKYYKSNKITLPGCEKLLPYLIK